VVPPWSPAADERSVVIEVRIAVLGVRALADLWKVTALLDCPNSYPAHRYSSRII